MANTNDFWDALTDLAKEKNISMDVLIETIENSLLIACKNNYGKGKDPNGKGKEVNASVEIDRNSGEYHVYLIKTVVEDVQDSVEEISLTDAHNIDGKLQVGDVVKIEVKSKEFGRIAATAAKNTITQKIREEERNVLYKEYYELQHKVVTGVVTRFSGNNIHVNLGKLEGFLSESEQVKGEFYKIQDRIKVYIVEVKMSSKGPRIVVSRTHPELVKKLFEEEVSEVRDGIVEIKSISREAGSRTKIAVWSNDEDVDPVGACVGQNGARVNAIVNELRGEKIDIVEWDENPAYLIENALSPAKVVAVVADADEKSARVVVPDYQLSLAIGKEGQNARLAARLTGFKIDIKSETQAREAGDFLDYEEDYDDDEYYDEEEYYDEDGEYDEAEADSEESSEEE
ncbi:MULTISPECIES: transcription termination factor NusA [Pseudobutyrivibrio]|jgi:N utilization substance protein A|uniref:Transcription termination/antitermination protein NusA n=3 Tax=Pseudobutyrivibrio TaxID=46205 RepID=A0A2G3EAF9_9FIRM|nr:MULTISPECIES: transcription termination factor NusA [Pseudobutyrivibrio]MBE5902734.1 transcription termination/antitermination protein NusA [Pseudobutyrivibrio sp.]NEX01043.1 transcription termination/antitermination protein NusA [Pseudobutyrivibrio xylanivorans]PHU34934.1 transcription termination/antitermination protein NusA [Pseudobutyrivibrio ruminis]PHU40051.1 transcription termination/antitermination protein NusA [Pseudobutyrivibrio ruminis]SCX86806.1 NusA antitermination factor [Pseu